MMRERCLICGHRELKAVIELGMHPFADTFVPADRSGESDAAYPLICDLCLRCGQIQLRCVTNPNDRYCRVDYSYTSSNSKFSRNHWDRYATEVSKRVELAKGALVVEIGSNDGYLTEQFARLGCKAIGVDPSPYMARLAKERGVETVTALFNRETADTVRSKHGGAALVLANNVFNHSDDPLSFATGVRELLQPGGTFVFELPYWFDGFQSGKFDQIYHEHVSYFTARSARSLLDEVGLWAVDVQVVDYHGGSLRVFAKRKTDASGHCPELSRLIERETAEGLFDPRAYEHFMERITGLRNRVLKRIVEIKLQGGSVVAVGAAAKGNTFLNFYRLDRSLIDYVTDASPHKQGKFTPLSRIPIRSDDVFKDYASTHALILSWNIGAQLKEILLKLNPKIEFIELSEYDQEKRLGRDQSPAGIA